MSTTKEFVMTIRERATHHVPSEEALYQGHDLVALGETVQQSRDDLFLVLLQVVAQRDAHAELLQGGTMV